MAENTHVTCEESSILTENLEEPLGSVKETSNEVISLVEPICTTNHTSQSDINALNQRIKTSSFQIISVSVNPRRSSSQTSDESEEDSVDEFDESYTTDILTGNVHIADSALQNDNNCNSASFTIAGVPVIPTSSQYGLAILESESDNSVDNAKLIKAAVDCANNISTGDSSVTVTETGSVLNLITNSKSDIATQDIPSHQVSRNERFKVVKIVSTEPFKRGRWTCMNYMDDSPIQQPKTMHAVTNTYQVDCTPSVNTVQCVGHDSGFVSSSDGRMKKTRGDQTDVCTLSLDSTITDNQFSNQLKFKSTNADTALPTIIPTADQNLQQPQQSAVDTQQLCSSPQLMDHRFHQQHFQSPQISCQFQDINSQFQKMGLKSQEINPYSQPNQFGQQFNPQHLQHIPVSSQTLSKPQLTQVNPQAQHINHQSTFLTTLYPNPQQFNFQTQYFNPQAPHMQPISNQQSSQFQLQQNHHCQTFHDASEQSDQCKMCVSLAQGRPLQQCFAPQHLQQVGRLNDGNLQQTPVQQDLSQYHCMHQVNHQGLSPFPLPTAQYYGQNRTEVLLSRSGMVTIPASPNLIPSMPLQQSPGNPGQPSSSIPATFQISGPVASKGFPHISQGPQHISFQNQQHQQQLQMILNQQNAQHTSSRQTTSPQQIPIQCQEMSIQQQQQLYQQQQQIPLSDWYSLQQQYRDQFCITQSVQQPLSHMFPAQQQPVQPQHNHSVPLSNIQHPGQQLDKKLLTDNIPVSNIQVGANVVQGHNNNHLGIMQGSHGFQQNYTSAQHCNATSSHNESFTTPTCWQSDKQWNTNCSATKLGAVTTLGNQVLQSVHEPCETTNSITSPARMTENYFRPKEERDLDSDQLQEVGSTEEEQATCQQDSDRKQEGMIWGTGDWNKFSTAKLNHHSGSIHNVSCNINKWFNSYLDFKRYYYGRHERRTDGHHGYDTLQEDDFRYLDRSMRLTYSRYWNRYTLIHYLLGFLDSSGTLVPREALHDMITLVNQYFY